MALKEAVIEVPTEVLDETDLLLEEATDPVHQADESFPLARMIETTVDVTEIAITMNVAVPEVRQTETESVIESGTIEEMTENAVTIAMNVTNETSAPMAMIGKVCQNSIPT